MISPMITIHFFLLYRNQTFSLSFSEINHSSRFITGKHSGPVKGSNKFTPSIFGQCGTIFYNRFSHWSFRHIYFETVSPKSVPWVLSKTKTSTRSPIFCPSSTSNTQTAFCEFLPFHWFLFFLETPSISILWVFPT